MEKLKRHAYVLAGLLIGFGVLAAATPALKTASKTEQWLESRAPETVAGYTYTPGPDNPAQSYRMSQSTYDTLQPFGIVSRVYQLGNDTNDVVLIAGKDWKSFHDPRLCFTAQGYELINTRTVPVATKSRGNVPVTMATIRRDGKSSIAAFCYRGPNGFQSGTTGLKLSLLTARMMGKNEADGVFFRFIAMSENASEEKLMGFIQQYLDASFKSSSGYF